MIDLIFYLSCFCISALLLVASESKKIGKKMKKVFLILALGVPIVISGIRYFVGTDFAVYSSIYTSISNNGLLSINFGTGIEVGFYILNMLVAFIMNNVQYVYIISALMTVVIAYLAICKYKENLSVPLIFFIYLTLFFPQSLNIVRQSLAVVIVMFSYRYLYEKNLFKFLKWVAFAACFHITAIIVIPFYFIYNRKNKEKGHFFKFIYLILIVLFILFFKDIINIFKELGIFSKFTLYDLNDNVHIGLGIIAQKLPFILLCLLFYKKLIKADKRNELNIYFLIIEMMLLMLGYFQYYANRLALYFSVSEIFILASIPKLAGENKLLKRFLTILVLLFCIGYFILTYYVLGSGEIFPYDTIFNLL